MISVQEAQQKVLSATPTAKPVKMHPESALGLYLSKPISSGYPLPFFDNSAMDGYAVRHEDTIRASASNPVKLFVTEVVAAGASNASLLQPQQTAQVLTGAMIAPGADAVIRQEDVKVQDGFVTVSRPVTLGENIRYCGEEFRAGEVVLEQGSCLTPAAIGLLTGAGVDEVEVIPRPRVAIVTTGSEVVLPGQTAGAGKIFNSNVFTLAAALQQAGAEVAVKSHAIDDKRVLFQVLSDAVCASDILLVTGGVSVGRFDYVKEVLSELGAHPKFWKVSQKPGKPLFFATLNGKRLFGLPGNPASALVCFYEYVYPCIRQSLGASYGRLRTLTAVMQNGFHKKAGLTHFLKGKLHDDGSVQVLDRQGSHMMSSFAAADCLVVVPEETEELQKGDRVVVHLLPV